MLYSCTMAHITGITLDDRTVIRRAAHVEAERASAIRDLLEENQFSLKSQPCAGHYSLHLKVAEQRLLLTVLEGGQGSTQELVVPLKPFKTLIRDYFIICESYFEAVQAGNHPKLEAIDMGRRGIHHEGAEKLQQVLAKEVDTDLATARRLFTLICVLHIA